MGVPDSGGRGRGALPGGAGVIGQNAWGGRACAGIERVELGGRKGPVDPLVAMGDFLLGRRVCTAAWLKGAGSGLRRRIAALSK